MLAVTAGSASKPVAGYHGNSEWRSPVRGAGVRGLQPGRARPPGDVTISVYDADNHLFFPGTGTPARRLRRAAACRPGGRRRHRAGCDRAGAGYPGSGGLPYRGEPGNGESPTGRLVRCAWLVVRVQGGEGAGVGGRVPDVHRAGAGALAPVGKVGGGGGGQLRRHPGPRGKRQAREPRAMGGCRGSGGADRRLAGWVGLIHEAGTAGAARRGAKSRLRAGAGRGEAGGGLLRCQGWLPRRGAVLVTGGGRQRARPGRPGHQGAAGGGMQRPRVPGSGVPGAGVPGTRWPAPAARGRCPGPGRAGPSAMCTGGSWTRPLRALAGRRCRAGRACCHAARRARRGWSARGSRR